MRAYLVAVFSAVAAVVTASSAFAVCGPHQDGAMSSMRPVGVCAAPPAGYGLDYGYGLGPIDARGDLLIANRGPVFEGPNIFTYPPPVYSESSYAYTMPYPTVQFYTLAHGREFYQAVRWQHRRHVHRSHLYPSYGTD